MEPYVVLYREDEDNPFDEPRAFKCDAVHDAHAEKLFKKHHHLPDWNIVWVVQTDSIDDALTDYYRWSIDEQP